MMTEAMAIARSKGKGRAYAIGIVKNWRAEGREELPPPPPKPERTYAQAPTWTDADREEARRAAQQIRELLAAARGGSS